MAVYKIRLRRQTRTRVYGLLPALALALCAAAACASEPRVMLPTAGGEVAVTVEVVDTPAKRNLGLMYRKDLEPSAGMLFVFDETAEHSFWMKNTPLPLDMIFIDEQRKIVGIVRDTVPYTTTSRSVGAPSRYVLEVHGGFAARHDVQTGAVVRFENIPRLAAAPSGGGTPGTGH
jgi:uncharacterized membrane protein (UPF0127 family)